MSAVAAAAAIIALLGNGGCAVFRPIKEAMHEGCPGEESAIAYSPGDYCVHTTVSDGLPATPFEVPPDAVQHLLFRYGGLDPESERIHVLRDAAVKGILWAGQVQIEFESGPVLHAQMSYDEHDHRLIAVFEDQSLLGFSMFQVLEFPGPNKRRGTDGWREVDRERNGVPRMVVNLDDTLVYPKEDWSIFTPIAARLRRGRVVEVLEAKRNRRRVRARDGTQGWIFQDWLSPLWQLPPDRDPMSSPDEKTDSQSLVPQGSLRWWFPGGDDASTRDSPAETR